MADNDLDRASKLLAKPNLPDADRNRILQAFPELVAQPAEIEAPEFLKDTVPEPAAPAPTSLAASAAPPPTPEEEFTYSALMETQRQAEIDKADFQPGNPEIRNLTKRASMYVDASP